MANIFQNPTKQLPKKDEQILRIDFEQSQIGGRKDHMPRPKQAPDMNIRHVESQG